MIQFAGQMLQAIFDQLEDSRGAIQSLLDFVVTLLLLLECLLHLFVEPPLAAGSQEGQGWPMADPSVPQPPAATEASPHQRGIP